MASGEELRDAMRRFPAGIAVLTAVDEGARFGVTVGSLVSLALEPPLVGVSIGLQSPLHAPLRRVRRFAASIMAGDQGALAQHFARGGIPPLALWTGVSLRETAWDEPLLANALAWLRCEIAAEHPAGDHSLFVADVADVELGRRAEGLVYVDGEYGAA